MRLRRKNGVRDWVVWMGGVLSGNLRTCKYIIEFKVITKMLRAPDLDILARSVHVRCGGGPGFYSLSLSLSLSREKEKRIIYLKLQSRLSMFFIEDFLFKRPLLTSQPTNQSTLYPSAPHHISTISILLTISFPI